MRKLLWYYFRYELIPVLFLMSGLTVSGCSWIHAPISPNLPVNERPLIAVLPFSFETEIQHLSTIKSMEETLSEKEEAQQLTMALQELRQDARWLFNSRLATRQGFLFVPDEKIEQAVQKVGWKANSPPSKNQLAELRTQLGADLIIGGNILDYGKVRWQWLVAGALIDLTAETIAIGLATSWNPPALFANAGVEVLINSALYFGGGYLLGVAFRPVRVEVQVFETETGEQVWNNTEVSIYLWGDLKRLPEEIRAKKEVQLYINLNRAIEKLADALAGEGLTLMKLRNLRERSLKKCKEKFLQTHRDELFAGLNILLTSTNGVEGLYSLQETSIL